jgi:hypothetical protein
MRDKKSWYLEPCGCTITSKIPQQLLEHLNTEKQNS